MERVGSVLLKILPVTLYSSLTCLLKIVLNLTHFEMSLITFVLQLPSALGVKSHPLHRCAGSGRPHIQP